MKTYFRHSIMLFVLTCFLTSTTGLNLVEHYCSHQEKSFVFLFNQDPDCEAHRCSSETKEPAACCEHEHTTDCCRNFSKFFKLIADYFSSYSKTEIDCPVLIVEHTLDTRRMALLSEISTQHICAYPDDFGLPERLLIKQTTEFLL